MRRPQWLPSPGLPRVQCPVEAGRMRERDGVVSPVASSSVWGQDGWWIGRAVVDREGRGEQRASGAEGRGEEWNKLRRERSKRWKES